jgi:sortase (surface protein transpeptidase)
LAILAIGLGVKLDPQGLNADGNIAPDRGQTVWYTGSPKPGEPGVSIIAAHVRYITPDVFWNLHKVSKGATIVVEYASGRTNEFVASSPEKMSAKALQHDASIWNFDGNIDETLLALITCDASGADQGFPDRIVVRAKRK